MQSLNQLQHLTLKLDNNDIEFSGFLDPNENIRSLEFSSTHLNFYLKSDSISNLVNLERLKATVNNLDPKFDFS